MNVLFPMKATVGKFELIHIQFRVSKAPTDVQVSMEILASYLAITCQIWQRTTRMKAREV